MQRGIDFEILGPITDAEVIASGRGIRSLNLLIKVHGKGRWRKMKGKAVVRLRSGREFAAEVHWYEAHGIGKFDFKIKRMLEQT
jgi:hypothetical protein